MRGLLTLLLICFLLCQSPAEAGFFQKKDYKQIFLNNALNAEKRKDTKQAFHSYEKAMYYYKKDRKVIESYAAYCERQSYYDKAEVLYHKLYVLTKDQKYLFKRNLCAIKNGKLAQESINKIIQNKDLNKPEKNELNQALIFHYAYKENWQKVKTTCDKLPIKSIGQDAINTCIVASEKTADKKSLLKYFLRYHELYPKDSLIINRIIVIGENAKDYKLQENFIKKLSALNPTDNGIKYKLAGLYEKQGDWRKAASVYEGLMSSGDTSEHIKTSYTYVLSQLSPQKHLARKGLYEEKTLVGFKLDEKNFYEAWKKKDYGEAQYYLSKMLKVQPNNSKLLKHRIDIDVSQNNYQDAIETFEKLKKQTLSQEDAKFLAFLYSKNNDNAKALEIIENQLIEYPKNSAFLNLALEYSLAGKNWDKAIIYNNELLELNPKSEKLLKIGGDLYSIKKDFSKASKYYEKLVKINPALEYKLELANLYMAAKNFESAQIVLEPLYYKGSPSKEIVEAYLNSLLAQQKTYDAYEVVRKNNLLNTKEGYAILGDLNLRNKMYSAAANYYFRALELDPKDTVIKNNLAFSYRMLGHITGSASLYKDVLYQDPKNLEARLGLGSLEIDKKNFKQSRRIFQSILNENPEYTPAQIATAYSYNANNEKLSALEALDKIPQNKQNDETNMLRAQIYYDINMLTDSKEVLARTEGKDAEELRYKIKRDDAITITPTYSFLKQTLGPNFRLDYHMGGIRVAKNIDRNTNVFMNYNVYVYSSGDTDGLNNVTNEFRFGAHSKPTEKVEYHTDFGVKAFEFDNGSMIVTDDWVKYRVNDKLALKLGFYRDNLIQTYTSAVGRYIDGVFTGRVADTRTYIEYEARFPKDFYSFGRACYGVMYAQNLPTNQYLEGMLGVGKLLYNNPKNPIIQRVNFDLVSFNWTYQYNLLNLYNSAGVLYGGYFSPNFFTSNTGNLKLEGEIKKLNLKYGCTGFAGVQISNAPSFTELAWGVGPYISYKVNDHIDINASYQYFDWAFMKRNIFLVSLVIRGFRKND